MASAGQNSQLVYCVCIPLRSQVMGEKKTEKQRIHRIIVVALRETIRVHGPIRPLFIGSAAKRIAGMLLAKEKKEIK